MPRQLVVVLVMSLLGLVLLPSCKGDSVPPDAQPAAEAWLALVDAGQYEQSWTEAASYFKGSIDSAGWQKSLHSVRSPLGSVQSRKLKSAKAVTSLPGAPDGEYVVFQFDASFDHKQGAVETVTPMKEKDGSWRVSGYYIK